MSIKKLLALPFFVLTALVLMAQSDVLMHGIDSSGNIQRVKTDSTGAIVTSTSATTPAGAASGTHGACTQTTMNVGTTSTACPPTPMASRSSVAIQLNQTGETLRVTEDGVTAATATVGEAVGDGSMLTDNLAGTVATNCRCTAATCNVVVTECP